LVSAISLLALVGCGYKDGELISSLWSAMGADQQDVHYYDVCSYAYTKRMIFEVKLNGVEVGAGGGGLVTSVAVPSGHQVVTWRDAGTGETFRAKNKLFLERPAEGMKSLGVHIYADGTVELKPEMYWPDMTDRGVRELEANEVDGD